MKITKYIHSCLVFELAGVKLLFDPGTFTFAEGIVTPETFASVDYIIITHGHPDHLDPENLKKIVSLSGAPVFTNKEVAGQLEKAGIDAGIITDGLVSIGPFKLLAIPVLHEPLLDSPTPEMTGFLINDSVLHIVDSLEHSLMIYKGVKLLILPVMAPFLTELQAADFADTLQPGQILPVHDGFAKEFFLKQRYENYSKHFEAKGIKFNPLMNPGDWMEV